MKRTMLALTGLVAIAAVTIAAPLAAQKHGAGAAHLQLVEATVAEIQLALQTRLMNAYLATRPGAPVSTLGHIVAANDALAAIDPEALKYGQAIFEAADTLDLDPGSADTARYLADRAEDLARSRGALDGVYHGPDGIPGTADDFDAILRSGNNQAGIAAKAGYPSVSVPGGFVPPTGFIENPFPSTVTFTGPAFSEPRLIALAYAFEQATLHRATPASTPPLPTDFVSRP
jgi:amidase